MHDIRVFARRDLSGRVSMGALRYLATTALQFLLFELANSTVAGVLLQFLNAAVQGYLAGCFYPSSFFPDTLRDFGAALPVGEGMTYLHSVLLGKSGGAAVVWAWLGVFLLFAVVVRFRRNRS